jgi:hypothetical protein
MKQIHPKDVIAILEADFAIYNNKSKACKR